MAEDSFQAPPSMKDVDEMHSGGAGNKVTSSGASTQRGSGGARVVQVGGNKGRNNNRDVDTSNVNDEFDF